MWIYWKEQCKYCKNNARCSDIDTVQKLIEHLASVEAQYIGICGSLKWECDYWKFDGDKYMSDCMKRECEE